MSQIGMALLLLDDQMSKMAMVTSAVGDYRKAAAVGGVTPRNRREVIAFIAQRWGISPDDLERAIAKVGIGQSGDAGDFRELVFRAWGMVKQRLPTPVVDASEKVRLEVREKGPSDDPMAQAETKPDYPKLPNVIRIFKPGAVDQFGRNIVGYMELLAHEMWHIFSDRNKLYWKLLRIMDGRIQSWAGVGKAEASQLMDLIDFFETCGLRDAYIDHLKRKVLRYWGVKYTLEYAEVDKMNGILRRIQNPYVRGMFDDAMAEAMASVATGHGSKVPYRFIQFVSAVGGIPGSSGVREAAVPA